MVSGSRGWGIPEIQSRHNGVKMRAYVLLHTWKSKEDELRYKKEKADDYEHMLLKPLKKVEDLGGEWQEEQVMFEPLAVKAAKEGKGCCGVM